MYAYRHYEAEKGRWPSRDPLQERGGANLYAFVGNSALLRIDILGMYKCSPCSSQCNKCWPNPGDRSKCEADCRNAKLSMNCGRSRGRGGSSGGGGGGIIITEVLLGGNSGGNRPKIDARGIAQWDAETVQQYMVAAIGIIADSGAEISAGAAISAIEALVGVEKIKQCKVAEKFVIHCLQFGDGEKGSDRRKFCDIADDLHRRACS